MKKSDGGPAFPRPIGAYQEIGGGEWSQSQTGMTLRDWFAGQALMGIVTAYALGKGDWLLPDMVYQAYEVADAMLAERSK